MRTPHWSRPLALALMLGLLIAALPAAPARAAGPITVVVNTTGDTPVGDTDCQPVPGYCSLRQAVEASNAHDPGAGNHNTIAFAMLSAPLTITRTNGVLDLTRDVAIVGPGARALTVTGTDGNFRVHVNITASVSGLTIAGAADGFGNDGTLTVTDSAITGNHTGFAQDTGTAILINTTISGGVVGIMGGRAITLTNSTIGGNSDTGIVNEGTLMATESTISGNLIGINDESLQTTLVGSIVAGNTQLDTTGSSTNSGHNLIGGDPKLGPLANNGGPTDTMLPLAGSPAIDQGGTAANGCPATDQRGAPRPLGPACDIGAVEVASAGYTTMVDSTADGAANPFNCLQGNPNTCRLRDAIEVVNQGLVPASPPPTIAFGIGGTILLTSGTLNLLKDATIDGTGHVVILDGGCSGCDPGGTPTGGAQVLRIGNRALTPPSHPAVAIAALTIQHGNAGFPGGGGILNEGTLALTDSVVRDNHTTNFGGGIMNNFVEGIDFARTSLTIARTTVAGNRADLLAGGLWTGPSTTILSSTFSGNVSGGSGGGMSLSQTTILVDTTVAGNSAADEGGGIEANGINLIATGDTIVGNTAPSAGGIRFRSSATLTNTIVANSGGNGGDVIGPFTGANNLIGGTPLLDPRGLQASGGPTQTIALLPDSPAIDAGAAVGSGPSGATVPANDQRGVARVGAPDIGAFEFDDPSVVMRVAVAPANGTIRVGEAVQLHATATYGDGHQVDVTASATWTSSAGQIVGVDSAGKTTGTTAGTATITASIGGRQEQAVLTVSPPTLTGVQPAPVPAGRPAGASSGSASPSAVPVPIPTGR